MNIDSLAMRAPAARYFSRLRLCDILVLQGTPLFGAAFGAAFAMSHLRSSNVVSLVALVAGNLFLMTHVFMVNDWAGVRDDLADPNKASRVFTARGVATRELAVLAVGLLVASLLVFSWLGTTAVAIAVAIAALSAFYSLRPFDWKGKAGLNTATHLAGGILHFLLGYCAAHAIDRRGIAIASYFALIFAAGHLMQEVRDSDADAVNGIGTNAVTFGPRRTFIASLVLFASAHALFLLLALQKMIPRPLAATVILFPFQLQWSIETLRGRLTYQSISRLQGRYRMLYAFIGVCILVALMGARVHR
jgi:4-hydroxybenzoate polyprenyltransferase